MIGSFYLTLQTFSHNCEEKNNKLWDINVEIQGKKCIVRLIKSRYYFIYFLILWQKKIK